MSLISRFLAWTRTRKLTVDEIISAEGGDSYYQYLLGRMYENGRGVTRDHARAEKWYRRAAEQGNATAQVALGALYMGQGELPENWVEVAKWMLRAADQGNKTAQFSIGLSYEVGDGVPKDLIQAHKWLSLCVFLSLPATADRRDAEQHRDRIATKMTAEEIASATDLAHRWAEKNLHPAYLARVIKWNGCPAGEDTA